jgi:hypothetical protein
VQNVPSFGSDGDTRGAARTRRFGVTYRQTRGDDIAFDRCRICTGGCCLLTCQVMSGSSCCLPFEGQSVMG